VTALLARLQAATTHVATLRLPDVLIFSARLALETGDFQAVKRILETHGLSAVPSSFCPGLSAQNN
jgi:hypothetical protein